jgi:hypothetical protein
MTSPNDKWLCLAAASIVSDRRRGGQVTVVSVPDELERTAPAVDLIVADGQGEIALEHSRIESLDGQFADNAHIDQLLAPIVEALKGRIGIAGTFELAVAPRAVEGTKEAAAAREQLVAWIRQAASSLVVGSPATAPAHRLVGEPPDTPFPLVLYRWRGPDGGRLRYVRARPDDLELLRLARARRLLEAKLPKLEVARDGRRLTVLVVESNDLSLANIKLVAAALGRAVGGIALPLPDMVMLVETDVACGHGWIVKDGDAWYPDTSNSGPHLIGTDGDGKA